jgi:hypothetical protein
MSFTLPERLTVNPLRFFSGIKLTDKKVFLACLSTGFLIRLVPELLAFPYPIGFDTIYYENVMKDGTIVANWSQLLISTWLLNAFILPLYAAMQGDPFLLQKELVVPTYE